MFYTNMLLVYDWAILSRFCDKCITVTSQWLPCCDNDLLQCFPLWLIPRNFKSLYSPTCINGYALWHHDRIEIETIIFGQSGVTRDSAILPHPSASPRVWWNCRVTGYATLTENRGINSFITGSSTTDGGVNKSFRCEWPMAGCR